jgi:hypothetical protein
MAHGGKAYAPLPTDVAVDRAPFSPGLGPDYGGVSMGGRRAKISRSGTCEPETYGRALTPHSVIFTRLLHLELSSLNVSLECFDLSCRANLKIVNVMFGADSFIVVAYNCS